MQRASYAASRSNVDSLTTFLSLSIQNSHQLPNTTVDQFGFRPIQISTKVRFNALQNGQAVLKDSIRQTSSIWRDEQKWKLNKLREPKPKAKNRRARSSKFTPFASKSAADRVGASNRFNQERQCVFVFEHTLTCWAKANRSTANRYAGISTQSDVVSFCTLWLTVNRGSWLICRRDRLGTSANCHNILYIIVNIMFKYELVNNKDKVSLLNWRSWN